MHPLYEAVRSRDVGAVRALLVDLDSFAQGSIPATTQRDPSAPSIPNVPRGERTLLHVTADRSGEGEHGVIEGEGAKVVLGSRSAVIAGLLIDAGLDVDARDADGATPLHIAVARRSLAVATTLIERGADVRAFDASGMSAIDHCNANTYPSLVALLLQHGASPDGGPRDFVRYTFLESLAMAGARDAIELALNAGADLAKHPAALAWACKSKRDDVVTLLLARGADPNAALAAVADSNGEDVTYLRILVERGADPTGPHLYSLAHAGAHRRLRALFEMGADPHHRAADGSTLYDTAAASYRAGNNEARHVMRILKERGVAASDPTPKR